jgi:hypothetical protein
MNEELEENEELEGYEKFCDENESEFLNFEAVETKRSNRSDIHAFLLLDEMFPGTTDMVCAAEHDQIWLDVDIDQLNEIATPEQMMEIYRCGVFEDRGSLSMFV